MLRVDDPVRIYIYYGGMNLHARGRFGLVGVNNNDAFLFSLDWPLSLYDSSFLNNCSFLKIINNLLSQNEPYINIKHQVFFTSLKPIIG